MKLKKLVKNKSIFDEEAKKYFEFYIEGNVKSRTDKHDTESVLLLNNDSYILERNIKKEVLGVMRF